MDGKNHAGRILWRPFSVRRSFTDISNINGKGSCVRGNRKQKVKDLLWNPKDKHQMAVISLFDLVATVTIQDGDGMIVSTKLTEEKSDNFLTSSEEFLQLLNSSYRQPPKKI